jgi:probable DNA repair protein
MYPWLAAAVEQEAVIVTASRRLARELRETYDRRQLDTGLPSWYSAAIHYFGDWLTWLLDSADPRGPWPTRIEQNSASILWERCLAIQSPDPLLSFGAVVRQARQSWQRLQDYDVPLQEVSRLSRSVDQQQFAKAAWAYREHLRSNNWFDNAMLPAIVAECLESGRIVPPAHVLLAGFDRHTPAVDRILRELLRRKCTVEHAPLAKQNETIHGQSCRDRQQELRSAGLWARQFLQRAPHARLAIICPDLEADAPAAARLVREGLAPGWQYAGAANRSAVNVSYGRRLAEFPAIAVALLLLRWIHKGLTTREVSVLLRSPFIVGEALSGRSRFELELRRWPDRSWSPSACAAVLRSCAQGEDAGRWLHALDRIVAFRAEHRTAASPAQWAEYIDRFLGELAWPGATSQDSAGYQLRQRWRTLLAEYAATALVTPAAPLSAAIERVSSMASDVIFQPETEPGIVQLLGILEASGMSFDAAWICSLDSTRWPPAPNPLVLVSRGLQEKYGMPDATPGDSLRFAELILRRVASCAREIVVSWSRSDGESQLSPSPMLAMLAIASGPGFSDPDWHARQLQRPEGLEWVAADPAPPVRAGEKIAGGAHTVQMQAEEPLAAFARGRLGIRDVQRIESGLSPSLKGSVAHQALHAFLAGKPDRDAIASWTDQDISDRANKALLGAIASTRKSLDAVHRKLLDLESQRLARILRTFVDAERARPPFAIEAVEHRVEFERFGVQLALRVDRIDRLQDRTRLIIDYKTGTPKSLLDREGNLADLQLALYALAVGGPIGGLVLINVDSRAVSYKGTGGSVKWDERRAAGWNERLASWMQAVDDALQDLARGDVRINPRHPVQGSNPLAILSRIEDLRRA